MIKISREEVLKIAQMSHIALPDDEIEPMIKELESVLNYAERVINVANKVVDGVPPKNVNVFRKDQTTEQHPDAILAQAPEKADRYFVVPMILEN